MAEFNIHGSKIEQLSESGNNYKIAGTTSKVAISEQGYVTQTEGSGNKVQVDHPKDGILKKIVKACWKWLMSLFSSGSA